MTLSIYLLTTIELLRRYRKRPRAILPQSPVCARAGYMFVQLLAPTLMQLTYLSAKQPAPIRPNW